MIIDVNAYLGHFAFRRLRHNTADSLLNLMDSKKIDRAVVSSASAITYRNPQSANEDLATDVESHRDRLIPFAVINPAYAGWQADLKICRYELSMSGLRLYPKWHGYKLSDPNCLEMMQTAAEYGMVLSIPLRVEDHRQRSWLVDVPDLSLDEVSEAVKACPMAKFMLLNGIGYAKSPLARSDWSSNYVIEISRLSALLDNEFGQLMRSVGSDRLVFGTGMPFSYPEPALLKLEVLQASALDKEKIYSQNAAKWLLDKV